jgi:CDP-diacylglycerol--glycerol-3-phosphate 3-phosphatidyltransferase
MKIANLFTAARIVLMAPLFLLLIGGPDWRALMVFLLAGATDIADGWLARRLNQASAFGAFFDLLADRLLTLVIGSGLIVRDPHDMWLVIACMILIGRNSVVAGLNEALPGRLAITVSPLEKVKIAFNFLGFALLMSPVFTVAGQDSHTAGVACLVTSAALCLITLLYYANQARKAFAA